MASSGSGLEVFIRISSRCWSSPRLHFWSCTFPTSMTFLITSVILMWKWMGLFLRKINFLRCLGWIFFLNCIGDLTSSLLLELLPSKLEPWFVLWSFFLLRLLCIFLKLPYAHVYNLVAMSGLVPLFATWNCWTRYKIRYTGLSVLHLLPLLNSWFIIKM